MLLYKKAVSRCRKSGCRKWKTSIHNRINRMEQFVHITGRMYMDGLETAPC